MGSSCRRGANALYAARIPRSRVVKWRSLGLHVTIGGGGEAIGIAFATPASLPLPLRAPWPDKVGDPALGATDTQEEIPLIHDHVASVGDDLTRERVAALKRSGRILDRRLKRIVGPLSWGLAMMVAVDECHAAHPWRRRTNCSEDLTQRE